MIEVRGLAKAYDGFLALKGVTFDIRPGSVFGFIGPNGAGKTTTIRILATLLEPTRGTAKVFGHDVVDDPEKVRAEIGYMPDEFGVYDGITVAEYLDFFAASYGLSRKQRAPRVRDVMELTDLLPLERKLVHDLSKGMRQRLCLAKTLVHDPKVLILDEPANGLDPRARIELRALLQELASMGKTIVISSHILTELSDLCTDVGIIERGELLASGPIAEVEARVFGKENGKKEAGNGDGNGNGNGEAAAPGEATTAAPVTPALRSTWRFATDEGAKKALSILSAHPEVSNAELRGERELVVIFKGSEAEIHRVVRAVVAEDVPLTGLTCEEKDLEALFMAVTKGKVQ